MRSKRTAVLGLLLLTLAAQPLAAQSRPASLLERVIRHSSEYLEQLSDVTCTESVVQQKLSGNGHKEREQSALYDYLILMQGGHDDFLLSESRLPKKESGAKDALPMLVTNGFSNLFLIFHPYFRENFRFEELGSEELNGKKLSRIGFTHLHGMRTPVALAVRAREYPLDLEGTAWIDEQTAAVVRIQAHLGEDLKDVGLKKLAIDVEYRLQSLPGTTEQYILPTVASVEVETMKQHWRNIHEFSRYRRFEVDSDSTVMLKKVN